MPALPHAGGGYSADDLNRYKADKKLPDIEAAGVQCDFCHSVSKSAGIGNGAFILSPGETPTPNPGTKYGPFKDAASLLPQH